jgi:hypothetical protein
MYDGDDDDGGGGSEGALNFIVFNFVCFILLFNFFGILELYFVRLI